jgi:hypothetical protein|tara:strand:+ start:4536 stop:4895 length:360 start_codon:yes stop_codon:yes gene_type:complete
MRNIIYANREHEVLISTYIQLACDFAKEVSTKSKYNDYLDVADLIFEYHNNYGNSIDRQNWCDWIMIIPINMTVMTNGFFAGISKRNTQANINSYKLVLDNMLEDVVKKVTEMKIPIDD